MENTFDLIQRMKEAIEKKHPVHTAGLLTAIEIISEERSKNTGEIEYSLDGLTWKPISNKNVFMLLELGFAIRRKK